MLEPSDWPPLTLAEMDALLRHYPEAGGAERLLSTSPRPFSAASVVSTPKSRVFVKRHHASVRSREGLLEEHRFLAHLATARWPEGDSLATTVLADANGETAVALGEWTYEVHRVSAGDDVYEEALSWTPFLCANHARAAGRALAKLHCGAVGYYAPARKASSLVSSFTIFAGDDEAANDFMEPQREDPISRMEAYLDARPRLRAYAEQRGWRSAFEMLFLPRHEALRPWLAYLPSLWTHNDFHASNLMWSSAGEEAEVVGIIDFGLADRTNAVHDLATAIERNIVEWLRMDREGAEVVHLDHLNSVLTGYEEIRSLTYEETRGLVAMLPLVHCEFALSETDYFLSVLHSEERAFLAYEGYFLAHTQWFLGVQGQRLLEWLNRWVDDRQSLSWKRDRGDR